jgi:hypothetical protein
MRILHGGDMIHARDLTQTAHSELYRDSSFVKVSSGFTQAYKTVLMSLLLTPIQYTLEVDCNERFVHMPEQLEAHTFYGQVLKFIELALPAGTITGGSHGSRSPGVEHDPS